MKIRKNFTLNKNVVAMLEKLANEKEISNSEMVERCVKLYYKKWLQQNQKSEK